MSHDQPGSALPIFRPLGRSVLVVVTLFVTFFCMAFTARVEAAAAPIFVSLRTTQSAANAAPTTAATATINPPASGWAYSAAAPVAGTIWNQILRPNPLINSGTSAPLGTYPVNTANGIGLADSSGLATTARLTLSIVVAELNGTRTEPNTGTAGSPAGLMDQAWRIYLGGNSLQFRLSALPVSTHYYLYCYAATTTAGQGSKFTVAAVNLSPGETAAKATAAVNSGNLFNADGSLTAAGGNHVVFHVVSDAAGSLLFTASKLSSGLDYVNGFQLMPFPAPVVSVQPPPTALSTLGGALTIPVTVAVKSDAHYTYLWRKDGTPIDTTLNASAVTPSLTLSGLQSGDAGSYDLVVTNEGGSVTSSACVVSIAASELAPSILTAPALQNTTVGGGANFSAVVNGSSPLTYSWQYSSDNLNFTDIPNTNSPGFCIAAVKSSDAGWYRIFVVNSMGSAASTAAALTVAPVVTSQPVGRMAASGSAVSLAVGVDVGVGAPTPTCFVWKRNGVVVANGTGITGAGTATLGFSSFQVANSGTYTVTVSNSAGEVTSRVFYVGTPTLQSTSLWPLNGGTAVNPDTPPTITFASVPVVGTTGTVRIYDAATDALVDSIDLASFNSKSATSANLNGLVYRTTPRSIGGGTFNVFPIVIVGNSARLTLSSSTKLAYGKIYYIQIDAGVLQDSTGATYPPINDKTTWSFRTKAAGPAPGTANLTVAADGSGDFTTLQGALDFIPYSPANTIPRVITLRNGVYAEITHVRSGQNGITINGESRTGTVIQYLNNNDLLNGGHFYYRTVMLVEGSQFTLSNLTVHNLSTRYSGQAEAITFNGSAQACAVSRCNVLSFQDTLFLSHQTFLSDCYVEGDVDFMWGDGGAFFQRCELKIMNGGYYTQIRNSASQIGYVYVDCSFTRASSAAVAYGAGWLGRIDVNATAWPASMMLLVNCRLDQQVPAAAWSLYSGTDFSQIRYWEYQSRNLDGTPFDSSVRTTWNHIATGAPGAAPVGDHQQVDAITAAYYSNPLNVCSFAPSIAPVIDAGPGAQVVFLGDKATLKVQGTRGYPAATWQWFRNGMPIVGANSDTLVIASAGASDAGDYYATLTNSVGSVQSAAATLTLLNGYDYAPTISRQPQSQCVQQGGTAVFSVTAAWARSYQWYYNGSLIPGATAAQLVVPNVLPVNASLYSVVVTNESGSVTSRSAVLSVSSFAQPSIPDAVFSATTYGAVGDGVTDNTAKLQAGIDALVSSPSAGGTLVFPAGIYLSGPITLRSNTALELSEGCVLRMLPYGVYPGAPYTSATPADFITVNGVHDVRITGAGVIDGQGRAWWDAYEGTNGVAVVASLKRPKAALALTNATRVFVGGISFLNTPNTNVSTRVNCRYVGFTDVTITNPATSPNTDGINIAGRDFLMDRCVVGTGDDNIVLNSSSSGGATSDIDITNCRFLSGHGLSIGSYTNAGGYGISNLRVSNCSFSGTESGIRLKSDADRGALAHNLSYRNLTMTNVANPIVIYSYYTTQGNPGATGSNGTTPAKVAVSNVTPPVALGAGAQLADWSDITISDVTITGASNYCVIWGLPNRPVSRVTLNNISITGNVGWRIYNARDIRFTGINTLSQPATALVTYNALVLRQQPAAAQTVAPAGIAAFSVLAAGTSGVGGLAPSYQWSCDGSVLVDGARADGSIVSGATTATLTVSNLKPRCSGSYTCVVSNTLDFYDTALPALSPASLVVSATSGASLLTVPDPLPDFLSAAGLSGSDLASTADPDHDGLSNLLEYVLGSNPVQSDAAAGPASRVTVANGSRCLVFEFRERNAALGAYASVVEYSSDLVTWTPAVNGQSGVSFLTTAIDADFSSVIVTIPTTSVRLFARLRVR